MLISRIIQNKYLLDILLDSLCLLLQVMLFLTCCSEFVLVLKMLANHEFHQPIDDKSWDVHVLWVHTLDHWFEFTAIRFIIRIVTVELFMLRFHELNATLSNLCELFRSWNNIFDSRFWSVLIFNAISEILHYEFDWRSETLLDIREKFHSFLLQFVMLHLLL